MAEEYKKNLILGQMRLVCVKIDESHQYNHADVGGEEANHDGKLDLIANSFVIS